MTRIGSGIAVHALLRGVDDLIDAEFPPGKGLARLFVFISFDAVRYLAGMTPLRPFLFALATLLGMIPIMTFLFAHLGGAMTVEEEPLRLLNLLGILGFAGLQWIGWRLHRASNMECSLTSA